MTLTRKEFLKYLAGAIVGVGALGLKCTGPSEEEQRKRHKEEWKDQEKSQREKHKLEHGLSIRVPLEFDETDKEFMAQVNQQYQSIFKESAAVTDTGQILFKKLRTKT